MHEGQQEHHHDQTKEEMVISLANAIVQPSTMMIETIYTSITGTAVLRCIGDMCPANIAFVLVL